MEEKHSNLLFPKKYFGCMMAIFIEQEPITQNRIKTLTNYSKTTISQVVKLLQLNFPIIQLKKPKKRKKYYTINITTKEFMITFLRMLIEADKDKADFIPPLIEEIKPHIKKHQKFQNFHEFLENSLKFGSLYLNLLTDSTEELSTLIKTGRIEKKGSSETDLKHSPEYEGFIQSLRKPPEMQISLTLQRIEDKQLSKTYIQLKEKFFKGFRENLTSARSQTAIARTILGTELFLENRPLTQEELERTTGFQRSIISDTLKLLVKMKMVQLIKKPGDRKNYYLMVQSWDTRTINRMRMNIGYAQEMKKVMREFIEITQQIDTEEENKALLVFFQEIHHCYEQFEQYFKLLEKKFLKIRLKEYLTKKTIEGREQN